jgi:hypothetical protein
MSAVLSPEWRRNPPRMELPRRASKTPIRTTPYGEEALCRSCQRAGYGEDAWHPITLEFWTPDRYDQLVISQCRACRSEVNQRKFGFVAVAA